MRRHLNSAASGQLFGSWTRIRAMCSITRAAEAAASSLAIDLVPTPIGNTAAEIESAIESFARLPNGGLVLLSDTNSSVKKKC